MRPVTTFNGGGGTLAGCSDGCGTVYVLIPASGGYMRPFWLVLTMAAALAGVAIDGRVYINSTL
jgi:hypothetical protein